MFDLYSDLTRIQGWLGAGKTETMLRSLLSYKDMPIVWISPRNGLLRQTAERAGMMGFNPYHYQDNAGEYRQMIERGEAGLYCMAPDSLKSYAVGNVDWSKVIVVIDEFSGIRKAFNSGYVRHLLEYFFETGETIEVESDRTSQWQIDSKALKNENMERTLKASLETGLRLISEEKPPRNNSEVWDVKLLISA